MANKKYIIRIEGERIEVSKDVYEAYYHFSNHEEYLEQKDRRKGKVLFSDLDTTEMLGEALIPDPKESVEDMVIARLLAKKVRHCVELLPSSDRALIYAVFYNGSTEREYAEKIGVSQNAIHKRKQRILKKLRRYFKK